MCQMTPEEQDEKYLLYLFFNVLIVCVKKYCEETSGSTLSFTSHIQKAVLPSFWRSVSTWK